MSGRCKSCDKILRGSEIIWDPETLRIEDLCLQCRKKIFEDEDEQVTVNLTVFDLEQGETYHD